MRLIRRALLVPLLTVVPSVMAHAATYPIAPTVTTQAATAVGGTNATLHGSVNPNATATSYAFQWGTSTGYGHQSTLTSAGNGTKAVAVSTSATGLKPGTTYHFRLIAQVDGGATTVGADRTFTTLIPPAVATGGAADLTSSSAELTGDVNPEGHSTTYQLQFGVATAYGTQTTPASAGSGKSAVAAAQFISGLRPATTYHYRLLATSGDGTTYGADRTFTTAGATVTASHATLVGRQGFVAPYGVASVGIACVGGTSRCAGTLVLRRGGRLLGSVAFSLPAQGTALERVHLNRFGRRLVRRNHRGRLVRVNAILTTAGVGSLSAPITLARWVWH